MRVLLVEDNVDFAKSVERALGNVQDCELVWTRSRDSALQRIQTEAFDLVILDRVIPTADDNLDAQAEHGWRVFQTVREEIPGTPVWFLTGTVDADFAAEVLNQFSRNEDLHGVRASEPMYRVFWKRRINECLQLVREFAARRTELERIAVSMSGGGRPLEPTEELVVRLFGRRFNGVTAEVTALSGGLSDSRVLKVVIRRADQGLIATAVAKVAPLSIIADEGKRFRDDISRLNPGGFPTLTERIEVGAGSRGGLFYGMVGDNVESVFNRIAAAHAGAGDIPAEVRTIEAPWYAAKHIQQVPVARVRRHFIGDTELPGITAELGGIDIAAMEATQITVAVSCQHGDLHCANIVFDQRGNAMLIDFGDAGQSFAAVDPVTLELSTVFHFQRATLPAGWPTEANMVGWQTVPQFVQGCAFPDFIRGCRAWAIAEAGSEQEISAVAYGYAIRQLKYADTDKTLARALIRTCIRHVTGG
jgi:CheY-like chemotaxis protein